MKRVDPLSAQSLFLRVLARGHELSVATGFVIERGERGFLVTNWHVLAGRNAETGELLSDTGAEPDAIEILHHKAGSLGSWVRCVEPLNDDNGNRLWREHAAGRLIDIAVLPLTKLDAVQLYPFDLRLADADMLAETAMPVSIIGYPLGLSAGGSWPIWKTGHIASDPDLDYDSRPAFLIDATTRRGMSGSPVVLRLVGGYLNREGARIYGAGTATLFLGVYSGRIHEDSEIGRVWRPSALGEILMTI